MTIAAAVASHHSGEVTFGAIVLDQPRFFVGKSSGRRHEAFEAQTAAGPVEVVDNVDLAPALPVCPGDRIDVRGSYVWDPARGSIVHWTHHDPAGRHPDGFIRFHGRVYA